MCEANIAVTKIKLIKQTQTIKQDKMKRRKT